MSKVFVKIGANKYDTADYTFPADRAFRNAWDHPDANDDVIKVDMEKAKGLWRDKIRQARVEEFLALDGQFMFALETGADTAPIAAKKQVLRDAPAHPGIDAATTPEELKAVQPIEGKTIE